MGTTLLGQARIIAQAHSSLENLRLAWKNPTSRVERCCATVVDTSDSSASSQRYILWRVFFCQEDENDNHDSVGSGDETTAAVKKSLCENNIGNSQQNVEIRGLAGGAWRELNRNVRQPFKDFRPKFVSVARLLEPGPIAVLVGLKYGGNVGTIVRSAVQSNIFQAIYLIEDRSTMREETSSFFSKKWGGESNKSAVKAISDKDIGFYSLWNAPFIEIQRFVTVDDFVQYAGLDEDVTDRNRALVCLDLGPRSINLYSGDAVRLFRSPQGRNMYLVIGAEDTGCPPQLVEKATALIEIPSMSASINVSCAFMACLSSFMMSNICNEETLMEKT